MLKKMKFSKKQMFLSHFSIQESFSFHQIKRKTLLRKLATQNI